MKRIVSMAIAGMMAFSSMAVYAEDVTLYAPDGRELTIDESQADTYCSLGWYRTAVTALYAPDGRQIVVTPDEVEAYCAVGWYPAPVKVMYDVHNNQIVIYKSEENAYKQVGWYSSPICIMYDENGASHYVPKDDVYYKKRDGWYSTWEEYQAAKQAEQEKARKEQEAESKAIAERIKLFRVGQRVRFVSFFSPTYYGTVTAVSNDKVSVHWTEGYNQYGNRLTLSEEVAGKMISGISIGSTMQMDPRGISPMS